ncbi:Wzz/FepE/Etk N-terminal domain-containing protein [Methylobacterium nigriterrae]|uniref:Wzz/FepE/Etk N-terminal domain-containing protein n=1 Tax=Methylobacterium nigriterrae TaxID=3127512 RepID=UPI0030137D50
MRSPTERDLAVSGGEVAFRDILGFLWRQRFAIASVIVVSLALALVYVLTATSRYTGSALVLIEPQIARQLQGRQTTNETAVESSIIDSQVEIAQSARVLSKVISDLDLSADPAFIGAVRSWWQPLVAPAATPVARWLLDSRWKAAGEYIVPLTDLGTLTAASPDEQRVRILQKFRRDLDVRRLGLTHVLRISFTAVDPARAERIAEAVAATYVTDELRARFESAELVRVWLGGRLEELRNQAQAAELAVQQKRNENSLAAGQAQITLRDLEREARTSQAVYEAFLLRSKEAFQQQSFPISEARIISHAERPLSRSSPPSTMILGGAMCFGVLAGIALGIARERSDRTFRTSEQVERMIGIGCLGVIPRVSWAECEANNLRVGSLLPVTVRAERRRQFPRAASLADASRRALLGLEIARLERGARVIGIVGTLPGDGATTVAASLAQAAMRIGQSVLLIDARGHQPPPKGTAPDASVGGALTDGRDIEDAIRQVPGTTLSILTCGAPAVGSRSDVLNSPKLKNFLDEAAETYDLVLVDLAPLGNAADARAIAPLLDVFVLVIQWGRTPRATILRALGASDFVYQRILGFILNKADAGAVRGYERDGAPPAT